MSVKEKAAAPVSSVGADGKQPLCKANKESIADLPDKGNLPKPQIIVAVVQKFGQRKEIGLMD